METVNEQTSSQLTITLYGIDGNPQAPTGLTYEVHDVGRLGVLTPIESGTIINPLTSNTLDLTPTINTILNSGERDEIRRVTFTATYGAGDQLVFAYDYKVLNFGTVT